MRLDPRPGERIDRSEPIRFTFEGKLVEGFAGDTIGSALYAGGRRVFSRSFKYHRPRGLLCCSGACPNCMMEVDGVPNVRVCVAPAHEGAVVKAQNVRGSLERDLMAATDKFGGPFTPVGFYYRTPPGRSSRSSCAARPGSGRSTSTRGAPAATTSSTGTRTCS